MTKLYLVRHGETDYNRLRRIQGRKDVPLDARGRREAALAAARLASVPYSHIISSDLSRAWETATLIGARRNIPILADERLRELGFGDVEGDRWDTILAQYPQTRQLWDRLHCSPVPSGEPPASLVVRIRSFLASLPTDRQNPIVIVAHGGPIRAIIGLLQPLPMKEAQSIHLDNASITEIELLQHGAHILTVNDTRHLMR